MTNGEYLVNQLMKKREELIELEEEVSVLESDLGGIEIEYVGADYAVTDIVMGDIISIYCENGEESWDDEISLDELLEIIK
jgi:hypothetical protein